MNKTKKRAHKRAIENICKRKYKQRLERYKKQRATIAERRRSARRRLVDPLEDMMF